MNENEDDNTFERDVFR